jgi:hypothetical protein
VSVRLTGALVAALALLAALPAGAAADLSRSAQKVYDDYRTDAAIQPCDHEAATYRRTLREITPDIEEETPAFRPAVEAALRELQRGNGDCAGPGTSGDEDDGSAAPGGGSTTPTLPAPAAPAPAPAKPPAVKPAPAPAPAPSGQAPAPAATPTPTPTVVPAPPVTSSAPVPPSDPVLLDRPRDGTPVGLWIALGLLALTALLVLLALAARRLGWGEERLAGTRHAWGEAAYRAGGTWGDFLDWVRLGR